MSESARREGTLPPPFPPTEDLARLFSAVAVGYGRPAMRFLPFAADRLVARVRPLPSHKLLDVATGTGTVALALARMVQRGGRVTGIDVAEGMIEEADRQARIHGLANLDWHLMDGERLDFRSGYFHAVTCNAGLAYMADPRRALEEWRRVLRAGGRLLLTTFSARAFEPMASQLMARLWGAGPGDAPAPAVFPWHRLGEPEVCRSLLEAAGFREVTVEARQVGYHLAGPDEWWEVIWHSELRGLLEPLGADALGRLRVAHREEVGTLATADGIWMDVETLFCEGRNPEQRA
jgi:ubiquinone/menaquinone biosynthesis C-methylase UbiE